MSKKLDELIQKFQNNDIKVVSFDIFDTLLVRPVVKPTDLFKIIANRGNFGKEFPQKRSFAEATARTKKAFNVDDIMLSDIYHNYAALYEVSDECISYMQQLELDVEFHYLQTRKSLQRVFNAALDANKEVIITSDMYLPKDFLIKVLDKCGYHGYSHLYLSCEYKLAKGTGKLFDKIINDYRKRGIDEKQILHIGDNMFADVKKAGERGMLSFHVPSAISVFRSKRPLGNLIRNLRDSLDNSFMIGYLANSLFDDPFEEFASYSVFDGELNLMGKILFAPFLLAFSKWMLEDCQKEHISKILFAYRDGFLPQKIINLLQPLYGSHLRYDSLYLSRAVRNNYYAKRENGLLESIVDFPIYKTMTIEQFAKERLFMKPKTETDIWNKFAKSGYKSKNETVEFITQQAYLIKELEEDFKRNAVSSINAIDGYCQSKITTDKLAVFDVGYRGSVSQFLKTNLNKDNIGYQIFATPLVNNCKTTLVKTFVTYGFSTVSEAAILHALIEDVISIDEGSATNIIQDGNEFIIEKEQKLISPKLAVIQSSIMEYVEGFITLFGKDLCKFTFDNYLHFELLVNFLKRPCQKDAEAIRNMNFTDSAFVSMPDNNVYEDWYGRFFSLQQVEVSRFRVVCYNWLQTHNFLKYVRPLYVKLRDVANTFLDENFKHKISQKISLKKDLYTQNMLSLSEVKNADLLINRDNILVCGDIVSYDKGICNFLNELSANILDKNLILISEAAWVTEENVRKKISFPFFNVPYFLAKNRFPTHGGRFVDKETKEMLQKYDYLLWAVENLKERHKNMATGYAEIWAVNAYYYYNQLFEILKPLKIILWNQFHALHHIIESIAKEKNIEIIYMEFGSIPGTFALENLGQMGESFPARYPDDFLYQDVSVQEINHAKTVLNYLKSSRLNRNIQAESNINVLKKHIKTNRPIVFYAGQNDFESGIKPYTDRTQKFHSPAFHSSDEAALFLAYLAEKNDWNFIYKPHPIMALIGKKSKHMPRNVIVVDDFDINELIDFADVTVTILSQTAYISLIRQKPTCMLGYTQLKGKGCTYEAFERGQVEETITTAIQHGYTDKMRNDFEKHTAQMLKYALYDDMLDRNTRYGQDIGEAAKWFL